MAELDEKLTTTNSKLDTLSSKLDALSSKLDVLNDTLATTNRRLTTLLQQDVTLWRINNNGDVFFCDSFEGYELHWAATTVGGATLTREYRPRYVYHGNASLCVTTANQAASYVELERWFAVPKDLSGIGFEVAFMTNSTSADVRVSFSIYYFDGQNMRGGDVTYNPGTRMVDVVGATTRSFMPQVNRTNNVWNKVKFTVNFENNTFKNLFFNNLEANISNIPLFVTEDTTEPSLIFYFMAGTWLKAAGIQNCWFDDFILTINEPQL
jgi:hypothetical protein